MSAPAITARQDARSRAPSPRPITIALLGLGQIGSAVARCASLSAGSAQPVRVACALVRDPSRDRADVPAIPLITDPRAIFALRPDAIVEALGGLEPARALVTDALERGVPVVTANKALLARHGEALLAIAVRTGTPLRYEASVLSGVPFLGAFAARPFVSITGITGIVNGTSNFILGRMGDGESLADAIAEAQRLGIAEPDPADDVSGRDAAHKLAVLAWHFGLGAFSPDAIETTGIASLEAGDLGCAGKLGGLIKPIAAVRRAADRATAFVGPAFVPLTHKLAPLGGVDNGVLLDTPGGRLSFTGPGAGPFATATTMLDDVVEAVRGGQPPPRHTPPPAGVAPPSTAWFVRLRGSELPRGDEVAEFLGSHGVWIRHAASCGQRRCLVTYAASRGRVETALGALALATGVEWLALRTLED
jgi:homoserine dehydrogenase